MSEIRVRFAPSPTGYLHVGGARTAIYNWLFAKANNGKFILRIEDTDRKRYNEEALHDLIRDMKWLGLDWDEGFEKDGEFGPYQQSDRLELYNKAAEELIEKGAAYYCFCTSERLDDLRAKQKEAKKDFGYDGFCRDIPVKEARARIAAGEKYVIRLKVPREGETSFNDLLRGKISYKNKVIDDMVLLKRDGFPTYHLASVVDDHNMKISHVLRGDEWITSTPKHVMLYNAFGWELPIFCHLPVILAAGGGKLSKRKGATSVGEYKNMGYLPETMINYLSLLGWNPGDDREILTIDELIEAFTLERISSSGVAFDDKKLLWLNGQHLANADIEFLYNETKPLYAAAGVNIDDFDKNYVLICINHLKVRSKLINDIVSNSLYFFIEPTEYEEKASRKHFEKEGALDVLIITNERLVKLDDWTIPSLEACFTELCESTERKFGQVVHPLRLAISGISTGPGFFELLETLGKEKVINRIEKAKIFVEKLQNNN